MWVGKWPLKLRELPSVNRSSDSETELESSGRGREKMSKEYMVLLPRVAKIIVFDAHNKKRLNKLNNNNNNKEICFDFSIFFSCCSQHTLSLTH